VDSTGCDRSGGIVSSLDQRKDDPVCTSVENFAGRGWISRRHADDRSAAGSPESHQGGQDRVVAKKAVLGVKPDEVKAL
jgi:hypothetical protein